MPVGPPTWGLWYWPLGMVAVSLWFLPAEIYALFTNTTNTLSDYSWYELGIYHATHITPHTIPWYLSQIAWLVFVAVITAHIWYRVLS